MSMKNGLSIPYWDFLVLNQIIYVTSLYFLEILSIPYWDFLVLNRFIKLKVKRYRKRTFNSLLGFSSFESSGFAESFADIDESFNSLLGFSSFESYIIEDHEIDSDAHFQFPIGIF